MGHLHELPPELVHSILTHSLKQDLKSFNRVSKICNGVATSLLWQDVELTDAHTAWPESNQYRNEESQEVEPEETSPAVKRETLEDDHDDTRIIAKLLVIANNERIASSVHTLTHRCHRLQPAAFWELPHFAFGAQTLSTDPRSIEIVKLAVLRMRNVHTLRIILGHPTLIDALLRSFFDARRSPDCMPVRRLWLESCRVSAGLDANLAGMRHPYDLPPTLDFRGLQSVRLRQMPMHPGVQWTGDGRPKVTYETFSRDAEYKRNVRYQADNASITSSYQEYAITQAEHRAGDDFPRSLVELYENVHRWDDLMFEQLGIDFKLPAEIENLNMGKVERATIAYRGTWLDPLDMETCSAPQVWKDGQRERKPSSTVVINMLQNSFHSLTSITLDWILTPFVPSASDPDYSSSKSTNLRKRWALMYRDFFECRFPKLRAFQFRNMNTADTHLPIELYLLESSQIWAGCSSPNAPIEQFDEAVEPRTIEFMEAHPGLECLSWPIDRFFKDQDSARNSSRVQAIVETLGRKLIDLRVDSPYEPYVHGRLQSEEVNCGDISARSRRRYFIENFAAKMSRLEAIKVEGRLPRDERREIIRALHACPLAKVVFIAQDAQVGNTWGANIADLNPNINLHGPDRLEVEDRLGLRAFTNAALTPIKEPYKFEPLYGRSAEPMLYSIAKFHSNTVRELKLCGFLGAPLLFNPGPTPIAHDLLDALKYFHNLESLVLPFWLTTLFEDSLHDEEVLSYWANARSPSSTALVRISNEEPQGWERELKYKYAPDALSRHIMNIVGPHLSEVAKRRPGGVMVRASFNIGFNELGGGIDVHDLDVKIGKDGIGNFDVCMGFDGPRDEHEHYRRKAKLDDRRWF